MSLRLLIALLISACSAFAGDWYVSQSGAGAASGSSCANAQTVSWLNTQGNWGAGHSIQAGDTVHLCGTITNTLIVWSSGTPSQPITISVDNASVSTPASTCISLDDQSYIILDGGTNGVIENTDNGSTLGNQAMTHLVSASGAGGFECKNLTIRNGYVHSLYTDNAIGSGTQTGIYLNGYTNGLNIHNCTFSNVIWAISASTPGSANNFFVSNRFVNYDHGVAIIGGSALTNANVVVAWNSFEDTAIWDTPGDVWHHDGVHLFYGTTAYQCGVTIHDNVFKGNWGTNNTAFMFLEGNQSVTNNRLTNLWVYNNLADASASPHVINNPIFTVACGGSNINVLNNTIIGNPSVAFQVGLSVANRDSRIVNNIIEGVSTFISSASTNDLITSLSNNIYAGLVASGNHAFTYQNTNYDTLAGLDAAANGQNEQLLSSLSLNSGGALPLGSPAIGAGVNLTSVFTNDLAGASRPSVGAWDVGALVYSDGSGNPPPQPSDSPSVVVFGGGVQL